MTIKSSSQQLLRQRVMGAGIICLGLAFPLSTSTGTPRALLEAGIPLLPVTVLFAVCGGALVFFHIRAFIYFLLVQPLLVYILLSLALLARGTGSVTPLVLTVYGFIYVLGIESVWERLLDDE